MKVYNFYSYEQQDEFIINLFDQKTNGFFIDIACGNPLLGNNSYALDSQFAWTGLCFESGDVSTAHFVSGQDQEIQTVKFSDVRNAELIQIDVTTAEFSELLRQRIPATQIVDYISVDVDSGGRNFALDALQKIVDAGVRFKAMTFEHEIYLNDTIQQSSRELLESLGYRRLFSNIRLWGGGVIDDVGKFSEDWWIDPTYFDKDILDIAKSDDYFFNCVKALKEYRGADYKALHHCCSAFANELDMFDIYDSHSYNGHVIRTPGWKSAWE